MAHRMIEMWHPDYASLYKRSVYPVNKPKLMGIRGREDVAAIGSVGRLEGCK